MTFTIFSNPATPILMGLLFCTGLYIGAEIFNNINTVSLIAAHLRNNSSVFKKIPKYMWIALTVFLIIFWGDIVILRNFNSKYSIFYGLFFCVTSFSAMVIAIYVIFKSLILFSDSKTKFISILFILAFYSSSIILFLITAYIGIYQITKIISLNHFIDPSNISTISNGTITIFGVLFAAFNAFYIANINKKEKQEEIKKEQILKVSSWIENMPNQKGELTLSNASNLPVYNVFIIQSLNNVELKFSELSYENFMISENYSHISILPPGINKTIINTIGADMGGKIPSISIIFKDSENNFWFRSNYGSVIEITKDDRDDILRKCGITPPYKTLQKSTQLE